VLDIPSVIHRHSCSSSNTNITTQKPPISSHTLDPHLQFLTKAWAPSKACSPGYGRRKNAAS
jgi:hypothetical protein